MNLTALEALTEVGKEMQVTMSADAIADIYALAESIRQDSVVSHLNVPVIRKQLWDTFRSDRATVTNLFSLTNTFIYLQGSLLESDIRRLSEALVLFPDYNAHGFNPNYVADEDIVSACTDSDEYYSILNNERWLYLLVTLSLNLRIAASEVKL